MQSYLTAIKSASSLLYSLAQILRLHAHSSGAEITMPTFLFCRLTCLRDCSWKNIAPAVHNFAGEGLNHAMIDFLLCSSCSRRRDRNSIVESPSFGAVDEVQTRWLAEGGRGYCLRLIGSELIGPEEVNHMRNALKMTAK